MPHNAAPASTPAAASSASAPSFSLAVESECLVDALLPDDVQIIAQGIGDLYPLSDNVAQAIASDAEYHLRDIIQLASTFMSHTKSSTLSVAHVSSALAVRSGSAPPGFNSPHAFHDLGFKAVKACPGLYVSADQVHSLQQYRNSKLPPPNPNVHLEASVLHDGDENSCGKMLLLDALQELLNAKSDTETDFASRTLSHARTGVLDALREVARIVDENASSPGKKDNDDDDRTMKLARCVRATYALLVSPSFPTLSERGLNIVAVILLTCLLSTCVGETDAACTVRELAAEALEYTLTAHGMDFVEFKGRVLTTIIAAMTSSDATLGTIYGSVLGLTAAGKEVCEKALVPMLPALFEGLHEALAAAEGIEHARGREVREIIRCICEAVALATGTAHPSLGAQGAAPATATDAANLLGAVPV